MVQRHRETGVCSATGVTTGGVVRLIHRDAVGAAAVAAALGIAGAVALMRLLKALPFRVGAIPAPGAAS